ncbi:hypothetical protein ACHAWF_010776 [Thalassiosira exigua]
MQGDVVTNVDLREAMEAHKTRKKNDSAAIMTVLLQEMGGWGLDDDDEEEDGNEDAEEGEEKKDDDAFRSSNRHRLAPNHQLPPLRSSTDDLLLALDPIHENRILLWDSKPHRSTTAIPTIFFQDNSARITLTRNYLDAGVDLCSPDVLARFSDEFDYGELRSQFVANCVAEEESGLQSRIFAHILGSGEYAGRVGDFRRYHRASLDLLRRWCYPLVPDNYGHREGCGGGAGGASDARPRAASYVRERHFVYRYSGEGGQRSRVGRSTQLLGPLLLGPNNSIGERCVLRRSVLGPDCAVKDDCIIVDSHLWGRVRIEEGARLEGTIVCEGAVVMRGAVLEKGCVVGRGCVVGAGVRLKEFTRITCAAEIEEEDDWSGFDESEDSSSSSLASSSEEGSAIDDNKEEGSEGSYEKVRSKEAVVDSAASKSLDRSAAEAITDFNVVGKDGLGRVYTPAPSDDCDDLEDEAGRAAALELLKTQSIGYDMTLLYKQWKAMQMEEEDDGFSLEGSRSEGDSDAMDEGWTEADAVGAAAGVGNTDEGGMQITGRQKGVDVVAELRDICLEHETSSPVENLRIELNSFKFSQNATYADCCRGATMAVMHKILEESDDGGDMGPGKLVASLKKALMYWGPLFESICLGAEEEQAMVYALESMATGGGGSMAASVLGKEPAFRFVLQTLHDQEVVNEEAIFAWAAERRKEGKEGEDGGPVMALFQQKPTQDFLEWLAEDSSESGSDSDGSDEDND